MKPLNGGRVASVFRNGRNQAIRLPRDMELDADQVLIERHGDVLTIRPHLSPRHRRPAGRGGGFSTVSHHMLDTKACFT